MVRGKEEKVFMVMGPREARMVVPDKAWAV